MRRNTAEVLNSSAQLSRAVNTYRTPAQQPAGRSAGSTKQTRTAAAAARPQSAPAFEAALKDLPETECRDFHRQGECWRKNKGQPCKYSHTLPALCKDPRFAK